ncbi:MAG: hypothetical protein ACXADY_19775 [Candidatus Hodarchaeales archaeon]
MGQVDREPKEIESHPVTAITVGVCIVVVLITLNFFLFQMLLGLNYFIWYVENGAFISIFMGLFALNWKKLKSTEGLLSSHPLEYFATCFKLAAIFSFSMSKFSSPYQEEEKKKDSKITIAFDDMISSIWVLTMLGGLFVWILIISPLNYLVTIISGAPARRYIRGATGEILVEETKDKTIIDTRWSIKREEDISISFIGRPFAYTQALTALFLWFVKIGLDIFY